MLNKTGITTAVILPTFNRAEFIGAAIQSILAQSRRCDQFFVIDDGSTDSTQEVVAGFADSVTYVRQANQGKLAAIAAGLDRATADLVWIMDDDDLAEPRALELLSAPFETDPECVLSYGRMARFRDVDGHREIDEPVFYPEADRRPFFVKLMERCFITGHPCVLTRRDRLEAMRPFDLSIIASVDYYLLLGVAWSGNVAFVPETVLLQRQHEGLRGPARRQYGESARDLRWIEYDGILLEPLLRTLDLGVYVGRSPGAAPTALDPETKRLAYIQKMVIAARKKHWPIALEALDAGLAILPDQPLDAEQIEVLGGALACRYGIDEVHQDRSILDAIRAIMVRRRDGDAALAAVSRPLLHRLKIAIRERNLVAASRVVRSWLRLMPATATRKAFGGSAGRNLRRAAASIHALPCRRGRSVS